MRNLISVLLLSSAAASVADDGWVSVGPVSEVKSADTSSTVASAPSSNNIPSDPEVPNQVEPSRSLQAELLLMVEALQQEVAELRGIVDQQGHQLRQQDALQKKRYLDMDRRLTEAFKSKDQNTDNSETPVKNSDGSTSVEAETLYSESMELIKQKSFSDALKKLDELALAHPDHALAVNALYWSGEVQLAESHYPLAIKQFSKVVDDHPQHNKAADALYKLAVAHDRNGAPQKAKLLLEQVVSEYGESHPSTVRLAQGYLKTLSE